VLRQRFLVYTENRTTPLTVLVPWQGLLTRR